MSARGSPAIRCSSSAQQVVLGEVGERGVGDPLQRLEPARAASAGSRASRSLRNSARVLDGERGAVGGELQQVALVGENSRGVSAADVQHADDAALDQQRDAEQRADALLAQDRVEDVGVVDVGDGDRAALGGDAAGEAAAERDADALLDLLLDPLAPRAHELAVAASSSRNAAVSVPRISVIRSSSSPSSSSRLR